MKRKILSLLSVLVLLSVLLIPASAAPVDVDRTGSITANMRYQGRAVPGGTLTIYRVAEISGAEYQLVEPYLDSDVSLEDIDSPVTAVMLAMYTMENGIQGTTREIGENGRITFDNLQTGLYLVMQYDAPEGFYPVSPFLVSIPGQFLGQFVYDVNATPKLDLNPEWPSCPTWPTGPSEPSEPTGPSVPSEPTEPSEPSEPTEPSEPSEPTGPSVPSEPTEPSVPSEPTGPSEPTEPSVPTEPTVPEEPELPQTGQLNWPIPVLTVAGMFFITMGLYLVVSGKKPDEA